MSYTYDSLNRLSTVVDNNLPADSNTTVYAYDTASNLVTVTYPNKLQSTIQYDSLNRLTSLNTATQNSSAVAGYSYTLGATGNRIGATEQTGRTLTWNYDGIYRLTSEAVQDPSGGNGEVDYTLDPVGNRTSATSSLPGVQSVSLNSFNLDDWLSPETYDANGNTLTTGGKSFAYDSENHLVSMNGGAVTMIYDAFGNRVSKTVGNVTTKYLVEDDVNPTGLPQVFEESVNGVVTRQYTYGLQRISENQVIQGAWTPSFYGYDGFGSVRQLTDLNAIVTDKYNYDAFGNLLSSPGPTPNNYLYRGEQFDSDLGLYYLRARYYNPATGRFMSRDLLGGKTFAPKSLHKYLYASGDPVNRIDPRGRIDVVEYVGRLIMDLKPAMQFINTMGCVVGIGISAMSSELNKNAAIGILATAYGCVRLAPTGLATLSINPDIDLGICAFSVYAEATDINEYLNNPTSSNQTQIYADAFGGVLGCGITALGLALEE